MAQTQNTGAAVAPGHVSGKALAGIQIDFGADVSAKLAVGSAVDATLKAIGTVDATGGTGQGLKVLFEGEHGTDTYDGSNSETLAAHLEDVIIALGTIDGINSVSYTHLTLPTKA